MSGKCLQLVHNQFRRLTNPTEKLMTTLRPLDRTHHHLRSGTDIQSSFPDPIRPQILFDGFLACKPGISMPGLHAFSYC